MILRIAYSMKKRKENKKASFFQDRAEELRRLNNCLVSLFSDSLDGFSPLLEEAKKLDEKSHLLDSFTTWGYSIHDLILPVGSIRNIEPNGITARLCIDCEIEADIENWEKEKQGDPFSSYSFRVSVFGEQDGIRYSRGFHIDRDVASESNEIHPLYHMHFYDGRYDNGKSLIDKEHNRGSISIRSPRFPFYPLDIVLGIGFCLQNYHTKDMFTNLYSKGDIFSRMYRDSQKRIIEPYFLAISGIIETRRVYWKDNHLLCPQIV